MKNKQALRFREQPRSRDTFAGLANVKCETKEKGRGKVSYLSNMIPRKVGHSMFLLLIIWFLSVSRVFC